MSPSCLEPSHLWKKENHWKHGQSGQYPVNRSLCMHLIHSSSCSARCAVGTPSDMMKIDFEETVTGVLGPIQRNVIKIHFKSDSSYTHLLFMKLLHQLHQHTHMCASQSCLLVNGQMVLELRFPSCFQIWPKPSYINAPFAHMFGIQRACLNNVLRYRSTR